MGLEKLGIQHMWIHETVQQFLITWKDRPPQTGNNDVENRQGKNPGYFEIFNDPEECTVSVASGSRNYALYSDEENIRLCRFFKMEEVTLPRRGVFFGHKKVQQASSG